VEKTKRPNGQKSGYCGKEKENRGWGDKEKLGDPRKAEKEMTTKRKFQGTLRQKRKRGQPKKGKGGGEEKEQNTSTKS